MTNGTERLFPRSLPKEYGAGIIISQGPKFFLAETRSLQARITKFADGVLANHTLFFYGPIT